ncbi:putative olfactory receptor 2I1 [Polypterus senegalus]|uniref:putative olfactory receptor 2I1 n=1 Tax=Polypterus senegalus TaxID=55291 RepID=UPI0019628BE1|nr:putative olfactory receptor 2I1 [Polypterus senegalus]
MSATNISAYLVYLRYFAICFLLPSATANENVSCEIFILTAFQEFGNKKDTYFWLSLIGYLLIIFVNVSLIILIYQEKKLHEPMYIFLCNLLFSFASIEFLTVPPLLNPLIYGLILPEIRKRVVYLFSRRKKQFA